MRWTHAALTVATAALVLAGCDGAEPTAADAGPEDAAMPVDADPHGGLLLPRCGDTEPEGTASLDPVPSTLGGTVRPTVDRVPSPDDSIDPSTEEGEAAYADMGLGAWERGPGRERVLRDDLGGDTAFDERRSIAWLAHLSDFQLVDDESPARWASLENTSIPSGLRPQEAFLPRAVSALNRTFARIEEASRPYDFGIVTGDCADSAQRNEIRWVVDIMDGETGVHVDSGEDDDPVPGPGNDPKDPFDAVAFPAPWLFVPGNHDVEVVGVVLPTPSEVARALGNRATLGTRDYRRWWAPVTTGTVPPDENRRPITREEIVAELFDTAVEPGPVGHGYPEDADLSLGAHYAHDAIPGLLRVLSLDSSDTTGGSSGLVHRSTVDGWLVPELERAESDGVLVMLASHHATTSMDIFAGVGSEPVDDAVDPAELERIVAGYPHVVAWLVGHSHDNRVRAIPGEDAEHPGYWEIMTSALADWPSQARLVEIVDNGNGTLSIFATLLDYDTESCMERRFRRLTLIDWQSAWTDEYSDAPGDTNVELVVPVPPTAVDAVAAAAADAPTRIESETALLGE